MSIPWCILPQRHLNLEVITNGETVGQLHSEFPWDLSNVGLIAPLVSVVYRKTVVEDVSVAYKTEVVNDSTKYTDYSNVTTKGQDGINRMTQDIKYINGEIQALAIVQSQSFFIVIVSSK